MTPPAPSLWLRFESGPLGGQRVALSEGSTSLGRAPGNGIVIAHGSVSGRHAELRVERGEARIVDLGSTNGTRINGVKVGDAILEEGCRVRFGAVEAVFEAGGAPEAGDVSVEVEEVLLEEEIPLVEEPADPAASIPAAPVPPRPLEEAGAGLGGGGNDAGSLETISADVLQRSAKRSPVALVAIVVLLAAGGVAAWFLLSKGKGEEAAVAVEPVPGNLVADGSFEDPDSEPWEGAEAAPVALFVDASAAASGAVGLGCALEGGEWTFAASPDFPVRAHRGLSLDLQLAVTGDVVGRAGLELLPEEEGLASTLAWAPAVPGGDGAFEPVHLAFEVPQGFGRARVVVAALAEGAGGSIAVDDVVCLAGGDEKGSGASFEEYELRVLGDPGSTAQLLRSGRVLFPEIALSQWNPSGPGDPGLAGDPSATWRVEGIDNGLNLLPQSTSAAKGVLTLDVLRGDDASFATLGAGGYRDHAGDFERDGVTDLLIGSGVNRIRVGFDAPARLDAVQRGPVVRLRIELSSLGAIAFQLTFRAERQEAARLARAAREAESSGKAGVAITTWSKLLDRFPFEAELVAEAQASRARLEAVGYAELEGLRREFERARFFELADLFEEQRLAALDLAERFEGSATEAAARELASALEAEREKVGGHDQKVQRDALAAVRAALAAEPEDTFGAALRDAFDRALASASSRDAAGSAGERNP